MPSIQDLREQRTAKAREARNLLDANTGELWEKNGCQAKYDTIMADIGRIDEEIGRHERVMDMEAANLRSDQDRAGRDGVSVDEANHRNQQERAGFQNWLRGGFAAMTTEQREREAQRLQDAVRNLGTSVPTEGGYLVPEGFGGRLIEAMALFGGMRAVSTVLSTSAGNDIPYPTTDDTAEEGEIIGENVAATDDDSVTFGILSLKAFMYSSKAVAVPFQLLQDSGIDIEAHIIQRLARRIARITNKHFTIGTGTGQPRGAVTASALGKTAASGQTAAVIYDDLVDLEHSVDPAYRNTGRCRFMFHDSTLKVLKKLKDGDSRPLWVPGVSVKEPDTILGHPYTINQDVPQLAAGKKAMLFGDFSYYTIRDVMQFLLFRMTDSAYTKKAQVGFLAFSRHDGNLMAVGGAAVKHFITAAS